MTRKLFDMDVTYVRNLVHEYVYICIYSTTCIYIWMFNVLTSCYLEKFYEKIPNNKMKAKDT